MEFFCGAHSHKKEFGLIKCKFRNYKISSGLASCWKVLPIKMCILLDIEVRKIHFFLYINQLFIFPLAAMW